MHQLRCHKMISYIICDLFCLWSHWHVYVECWYRRWRCNFNRDVTVLFLYQSMCNSFCLSCQHDGQKQYVSKFEIIYYNLINSNATTAVPFDHLTRNSAKHFRKLCQIICEHSVKLICQRRWYSTPTNSCSFSMKPFKFKSHWYDIKYIWFFKFRINYYVFLLKI